MTVKDVFEGGITFLNQLFNCFLPILFYRLPPIFLDSEGICFGAPASLIPTFVDDGEYMFFNNLHAMGKVCKKGWLWDFCIKLYFGLLKSLTSGTFGLMLDHSSHCAAIVTDYDINDKEEIIECILYHLQNCRRLHTF